MKNHHDSSCLVTLFFYFTNKKPSRFKIILYKYSFYTSNWSPLAYGIFLLLNLCNEFILIYSHSINDVAKFHTPTSS